MPTKLLLAGDVMTGRGVDQVMRYPCPAALQEPFVHDAREYVRLAERAHGPIPFAVEDDYIWGDALADIDRFAPDARIINLETAVTCGGYPWPRKAIRYRMNPAHLACLAAARVDACVLANNHVLDWGEDGLSDTLSTLRAAGFATAGAGRTAVEAGAPAVIPLQGGGRVLVFAFAGIDSGTPPAWEANHHPGISMLRPDNVALKAAADRILQTRQPGDIAVVSLHWGANWVDHVPPVHRRIAHYLIEANAADVIHGHSSHHPLPAEVHNGKLILYGCGDLINDYEGIETGERARTDLVCLYGLTLRDDGSLEDLEVMPFQLHRFRLCRPKSEDRDWLRDFINARSQPFRTHLEAGPFGHWRLAA
jgi:poly-gamma-glutamate synthesis protein (capsule biosynthesis protein)